MIDATQPLPIDSFEKQTNNRQRPPVITSWKSGQSGNPNGRPKKDWTWADLLTEAAEEYMEIRNKEGEVIGKKQLKKIVAKKMLTAAAGGNMQAAAAIMNRMDGMPLQATDITSAGEKLIAPHVTVDTKPDGKTE